MVVGTITYVSVASPAAAAAAVGTSIAILLLLSALDSLPEKKYRSISE
jgi:hypothetical protein